MTNYVAQMIIEGDAVVVYLWAGESFETATSTEVGRFKDAAAAAENRAPVETAEKMLRNTGYFLKTRWMSEPVHGGLVAGLKRSEDLGAFL